MCHTIYSGKGNYFMKIQDGFACYLLGMKTFLVGEGTLLTGFFSPRMEYHINLASELGRATITCENPVRSQAFALVMRTDCGIVSGAISRNAGMHIYALHDDFLEIIEVPQVLEPGDEVTLLVAFNLHNIIFFDGQDISVDRFYVLDPSRYPLSQEATPNARRLYSYSWDCIRQFTERR